MKKSIWIDIETTGLDCKKDTIIELAALCGDDIFHEYCLPKEKPSNWKTIEDLTGITWEYLEKNGINEEVLYHRFEGWLCNHVDKYNKKDKAVLCGYGVQFDKGFLYDLFERHFNKYFGSFFFSLSMDVQSFVAEMLGAGKIPMLENYKLSTVCAHFGIELQAHSAIEDIEATKKIYGKVCDLKAPSPFMKVPVYAD